MVEATDIGLKAFDKYEKFYTHYKRPPLAKVYTPTSEEFADPIAYVAKIKAEAEKYGVVKIIPPKEFKPSFAIDKNSFTFRPRVQKLDEIEAIVREKNAFTERITHYWELQGTTYRPPVLENRPVDLFKAHILIRSEGGFETVCINKRWTAIAKGLNLKSNQAGSKVKEHYIKWVLPYMENVEKKKVERVVEEEEEEEEKKEVKKKECEESRMNRGLGEGRSSMQGGGRHVKKSAAKNNNTEMDVKRECSRCTRGDDGAKLVKCETCNLFLHTFCMRPPMKEVPKNGWNCLECTESRVRRMGETQGFMDSPTTYTLNSFTTYANDYKRDIFGKEPQDVTLDEMESTYWRNMLTGEHNLQVKYGADLMVSNVGSGFCRKSDVNLRHADKLIANHPWNLNNMPVVRDSVLSHIDSSISGMMVPWVYVGMSFSTFCWHTEDHWTYSVNYNHWGEPKIWYGVGADEATKFEEVVRGMCPSLFRLHSDLLHHMTVAVNPYLLRSRGVNVYTVHQAPGEFVITFPRAYHAGFNQGLNFAEAVNFAPIDWLSMGRDCMLSYGEVGRTCVFSHDELVMKITRATGRISKEMAKATLDELKIIHSREESKRAWVADRGVKRRKRLIFEKIEEDDEKMCRYCKNTLFMSGIRCGHGHSVCLDHVEHVCKKCPLEELELLFSYEVDEMVPMLTGLGERIERVREWERRAEDMMNGMERGEKPDLHSMESLMEEARVQHLPNSGIHSRLNGIVKEYKTVINQVDAMIGDGVRVRSSTRMQSADKRLELNGVRELEKRLSEMPVIDEEVYGEVKLLISMGEDWESRRERAMSRDDIDEEEIRRLVEEANEIKGIKLDTDAMKMRDRRQRFLNGEVRRFLDWKNEEGMEMKEEWLMRKRWSFNETFSLYEEGRMVGVENSRVIKELSKRRKEAAEISSILSSDKEMVERGVERLEEDWKRVRDVDWLNEKEINSMRREVFEIVRIRSYERAKQFSVFDYIHWIDHVDNSKTMPRGSGLYPENQVKMISQWTDKLRSLFELEISYHSLYEMLICRDNVVALSIGQKPTLKRETDKAASIAIWKPVYYMESYQQMIQLQEDQFDRFPEDIQKLRSLHDTLPPSKTCPCLSERDESTPLLVCIVCSAKTHLSCGWWNEYLGRLPPGCFLCVRCMRSRRPLIGEVKKIMEEGKEEWMETHCVRLSIDQMERRIEETKRLNEIWKGRREDEGARQSLSLSLICLLSLEMTDSSFLASLTEPIAVLFRSTLENQRDAWEELRKSVPSSLSSGSLFTKRRSAALSLSPVRKRKREEERKEKEIPCSHQECLLPSRSARLVKCEECKRWFHIICTGQIIDPDLSTYVCCQCCQ